MTTLHIEHPVADFDAWAAAFDRFTEARERHGVRAYRILRQVDDARYVVIDLDFDTTPAAETFLRYLEQDVWPANANSHIGTAQTRILEPVRDTDRESS